MSLNLFSFHCIEVEMLKVSLITSRMGVYLVSVAELVFAEALITHGSTDCCYFPLH